MMDLVRQFKQARRVGTPLIAVRSTDPAVTRAKLFNAIEGCPKVKWDCAAGVEGVGELGTAAVVEVCGEKADTIIAAPQFLEAMLAMPAGTLVIAVGLGAFAAMDDERTRLTVNQLLYNMRDVFKTTKRTLVMIDPSHRFEPIVRRDVWMLDDPPPSADELAELTRKIHGATVKREPTEDETARAVAATRGLPAFLSEQAMYMTMTRDGLDFPELWERKRVMISDVPGLSVWRGSETFADVAGYDQAKLWARRIIASPQLRPELVVFLDEIEKGFAGATSGSGDNTGTSQGILQSFLIEMQNRRYHGGLFLGPPGSGKSAIAKAIGGEAGCPLIEWDVNKMKTSALGATEQATAEAFATIYAASGGRALFIATCNRIETLPPELRRRFKRGTFYFDLPTAEERRAIWALYLSRYGLDADPSALPFSDAGWTGAEIETACENAAYLGLPLAEAAQFVVPVARSAAEEIKGLRRLAHGRFLSASYPGAYDDTRGVAPVSTDGLRRLDFDEGETDAL